MTPLKTYNLKLCFLHIDGERIEGFDEDDAVSFEEGSDTFLPKTGADGQHTVTRTNDKSMTATITVMENSLGCQTLRRIQVQQLADSDVGSLPRIAFQLVDKISGDKIADDFCVFLNEPGPSKGLEVGTREFRLFLPNGKDAMLLADSVTA